MPLSFDSSSSRRISCEYVSTGPANNGHARTHLHGHDHLCRLVIHLLHTPVIPLAQLFLQLHLVLVDLVRRPIREIHSVGMQHGFTLEIQPPRRIHDPLETRKRRIRRANTGTRTAAHTTQRQPLSGAPQTSGHTRRRGTSSHPSETHARARSSR